MVWFWLAFLFPFSVENISIISEYHIQCMITMRKSTQYHSLYSQIHHIECDSKIYRVFSLKKMFDNQISNFWYKQLVLLQNLKDTLRCAKPYWLNQEFLKEVYQLQKSMRRLYVLLWKNGYIFLINESLKCHNTILTWEEKRYYY